MKKLLNTINKILKKSGYQSVESRSSTIWQKEHDPSVSFMRDEKYKELLIRELRDTAQSFQSENMPEFLPEENLLKKEIESFYEVYSERPFLNNTGGSGLHNSFWAFSICTFDTAKLNNRKWGMEGTNCDVKTN